MNEMLACARTNTYQLNGGFNIIDNILRVCPAWPWTLAEWRREEGEKEGGNLINGIFFWQFCV